MKVLLLTLLFTVSLIGPAWARLGETEDQLIARYGQEVGKGSGGIWNKAAPDSIQFCKGGFFIIVWLVHGVSGEELIMKDDHIRHGKPDPLTLKELKTLVEVNAQGQTWKEVTLTPGLKWQRDDGTIAGASPDHESFDVKSKEMMDANTTADTKPKHPPISLEGF